MGRRRRRCSPPVDEVDAAFVLVESRLAPAAQRHLYFSGEVRVSVSFGDEPRYAYRVCRVGDASVLSRVALLAPLPAVL